MTVTLYGIKACDTMKKARDWLEGQGVRYIFHDYKLQGIAPAVGGRGSRSGTSAPTLIWPSGSPPSIASRN